MRQSKPKQESTQSFSTWKSANQLINFLPLRSAQAQAADPALAQILMQMQQPMPRLYPAVV